MILKRAIFVSVLLIFSGLRESNAATQGYDAAKLLQQTQKVYSAMRHYGCGLEIISTGADNAPLTKKLSLLFLQNPKSLRLKMLADDTGAYEGREYFYVTQPMRASWGKYRWSRPLRFINTRLFRMPTRIVIEHPYEKFPFLQRSYAIRETSDIFSGQFITTLDIGWVVSHFLETPSSPAAAGMEMKNGQLCYKIKKGDEILWINENTFLPAEARIAQPDNNFVSLKWKNITMNVRAVEEEFLGHRNYNERKKFLLWFVIGFIALFMIHHKIMNRRNRILLYIFSIIFAGFLFGSAVHPVGRMQDIYLGLLDGTYHFPRYLGIILAAGIPLFLVGRIYCGYACPFGVIQELLYETPVKKLMIITQSPMLVRKFVFILMLFAGIVLAYPLFGFLNITGGRLSVMNLSVDFPYILAFAASFADIVLLLLIFAVGMFLYRPYCRFLCPFGFVAAWISRISLIQFRKDEACIECRLCDKVCPTGAVNTADKGECYYCARCLDICKKEGKALTNVNGTTIRIAILCVVLMALIIVHLSGYAAI